MQPVTSKKSSAEVVGEFINAKHVVEREYEALEGYRNWENPDPL